MGNVFDHSKLDPLVTSPSTAGVREGKYFEYRVNRSGKPAATTVAAWKGALTDNRGHAILLIDEDLLTDIAASVAILKQDLITDGWTVTDLPVKRHLDLAYPYPTTADGAYYISQTVPLNKANQIAIKKTIRDTVAAHSGVPNVVYLIGHVTVPYSGLGANEDGHGDHAGAWPADSWYGDLSWEQSGTTVNWNPDPPTPVEWPDTQPDITATGNNNKYLNYNYSGDGKFDRNTLPPEVPLAAQTPSLPGRLEVAVGRIDFQFMDPYLAQGENLAQVERRLLNNYLGKVHRYRRGDPSIAYADDAVMQLRLLNPGILNSVRRLHPRQWGTELFDNDDDVFLQNVDHLWGIHEDVGHHTVFGNVPGGSSVPQFHDATDIAKLGEVPRAMFLLHFGSYLGEWFYGVPGNGLRVELGATNSALATTWVNAFSDQATVWKTDRFHLGWPYATVLQDTYSSQFATSCRGVAILGDPFLREHRLTPLASLSLTKPGTSLILTWSHVPAATDGYRVYQASSASSQTWNFITNLPAGTTQWTVPTATSLNGTNAFIIKSRELKTTGAGSYYNLSVGTISNEMSYP